MVSHQDGGGTRKSGIMTALIFGLFLASIALPWLWFHTGPALSAERFKIVVSQQVSGFSYTKTTVSEQELRILATTNLMNGKFVLQGNAPEKQKTRENRRIPEKSIRTFVAEWKAESGQDLAVVHHTPDICWIRAGWSPISLGQPTQALLELPSQGQNSHSPSTVQFPFECRVFRLPNGGYPEMVLWCTLVGGQVLPEIHLFQVLTDDSADQPTVKRPIGSFARRLAISHLWQLVQRRVPAQSSKQFVRLSIPITDSWESALEDARSFAKQWIEVKRQEQFVRGQDKANLPPIMKPTRS